MSDIEELHPEEREALERLLRELDGMQGNQYRLRLRALKGIVELLPIKGYCTVLWMNRFFSEVDKNGNHGKVFDYIHVNHPPFWLKKLWQSHIQTSSSIIEQAIYKKYVDSANGNKEVGFATRTELVDKKPFLIDLVGMLAVSARIREMGYLWLRIAPNDFWVFCLRKFRSEPGFTPDDRLKLQIIGNHIWQMRRRWHTQFASPLAERQLEVYDRRYRGETIPTIASEMRISESTVKEHLARGNNKLNAEAGGVLTKIDTLFLPQELQLLSPFQIKIIRLLTQEKSQRMVAEELGISEDNLKGQLQSIYKKLDAHNLLEAIMKLELLCYGGETE